MDLKFDSMKKTLLFALAALALVSCGPDIPLRHPKFAYDATIYELNVRQATPEGTFQAAEALLPALKDNGIDIIWVMPCQPIGKITRKGTLGSYYSIIDYCAINPEFGTRADFEHFLKAAHKKGFKVILDWVANHTAPDSEWTKNEGWHYRDSLGNLMVQYDWTDISKLNYDNQDMRNEMLKSMHWWMDSIGRWQTCARHIRTCSPSQRMKTKPMNSPRQPSTCITAGRCIIS